MLNDQSWSILEAHLPFIIKKIILFSLKNKLFLLFIQYEQCYYIQNQLGDRVQFLFKELLLWINEEVMVEHHHFERPLK